MIFYKLIKCIINFIILSNWMAELKYKLKQNIAEQVSN